MSVDLFTPQVAPELFHYNFKAALHDSSFGEREVLTRWANDFTDKDGKFVKEFQTTFNSAYWELYLHAAFRDLGFSNDLSHASPDFILSKNGANIIIEATSANAAEGKPKEWERDLSKEGIKNLKFDIPEINREATIRLSNAVIAKLRKYKQDYSRLNHVCGKPFVIAIGPFEQPYFYLQFNRAIRSLLYDDYVDEEAFKKDPASYPFGPPSVSLGTITKDNGSDIELGFFNSSIMEEISAVIFSCTATWGKLDALATSPKKEAIFNSMRHDENGVPKFFTGVTRANYTETLLDGIQVYHNSYAKYPLPTDLFRRKDIAQHFYDESKHEWVHEGIEGSLAWRQVFGIYGNPNM